MQKWTEKRRKKFKATWAAKRAGKGEQIPLDLIPSRMPSLHHRRQEQTVVEVKAGSEFAIVVNGKRIAFRAV